MQVVMYRTGKKTLWKLWLNPTSSKTPVLIPIAKKYAAALIDAGMVHSS